MTNVAVTVAWGKRMPSFKFLFLRSENKKGILHAFLKLGLALLLGTRRHFSGTFFPAVSCAAGHHLRGHYQRVSLSAWLLLPLQSWRLAPSHRNLHRSRAELQLDIVLVSQTQWTCASLPYLMIWLHENKSLITHIHLIPGVHGKLFFKLGPTNASRSCLLSCRAASFF